MSNLPSSLNEMREQLDREIQSMQAERTGTLILFPLLHVGMALGLAVMLYTQPASLPQILFGVPLLGLLFTLTGMVHYRLLLFQHRGTLRLAVEAEKLLPESQRKPLPMLNDLRVKWWEPNVMDGNMLIIGGVWIVLFFLLQ